MAKKNFARLKGQASLDYYVALVIFIFIVVYILFQITNLVPVFTGQMEDQRVRIEVYQISELLINDPGKPLNWEGLPLDNIERIGLSDHTMNKINLISRNKIAALESICDSTGLQTIMGTDFQISAFITDKTNGQILMSCEPVNPVIRGAQLRFTRIVAFDNGNFGELSIQIWKR